METMSIMGKGINLVENFKVEKAVFSCRKFNELEQELIQVLANLENSKIYRTVQDGSIMFEIQNNKLQIDTCPL